MPSTPKAAINEDAKVMSFRYGVIGLLAAVGIALSYASFKVTQGWEDARALNQLQEQVRNHGFAIEEELLVHLDFLKSINALYETSPFVSRNAFRFFTQSLLKRARGVQALEWIPRIADDVRDHYEWGARDDGLANFQIKEKDADGNFVAAGTRPEYFPVYYVEPLKGNEKALGFDLGSNATRLEALTKARDTGNVVVSARIKLVQETGDQFAFLAFHPIYQKNFIPDAPAPERKTLLGFALGVFRIGDVVENALAKQTRAAGLDIYVFDNNATGGNRFLYFHPSRARKTKPPPVSEEEVLSGPHLTTNLMVGDRQWSLVFKPIAGHFAGTTTWLPWSALIVGLLFTVILTAYLMSAVGRERRITNLVRARTNELKDSEERFRHLIEGSVQGVLIHNYFKPVFVNQAYADILGYAGPEDILAHSSALDHVAEEDRERLKDYADARFMGKEAPDSYEFQAIRKDGSLVWLENRVRTITWEGKPANQRIVTDITERKQSEEMKNEFISTVSHELRTPLTSIKGSLGLIRTGVIGELPEKLKSLLEIAYANSDRLERLINDILDIEKIEAGKMSFHLQPVEIVELVEKAIEANKGFGDEHGVSFVFKERPEEKAVVDGEEDRLMQVMSNLMSNAAKFSPEGEPVEISVTSGAVGIRVSVADRGPGVSQDFQDKIFEKFSQADSSDTRQQGGTGLGLSITKAIIEHHDGVLGFETEEGNGTTFYFVLPPLVELGANLINADGMAGQYRALIVEDEPDIAMILEMTLRQDGFSTGLARTAVQAKEMLEKDSYDVMTLDLGLPDQNGISLIKDLRSQPQTRNLPIVVVSATAIEGARELNGDAVGVIDWLQKPIDQDRLRECLRYAMQSGTSRKLRILHVEDDTDVIKVVSNVVNGSAHITAARTLRAAKRILESETFDLVILDLMLPDGAGENVLPMLRKQGETPTPVIVFSAKDVSQEITQSIEAVLLKSRTTNEDLLEAIRSAMPPGKGESRDNVYPQ